MLKKLFGRKPEAPNPYSALVEQIAAEDVRNYDYKLKEVQGGPELLAESPEKLRLFVLACLDWFRNNPWPDFFHQARNARCTHVEQAMWEVMRRKLPFEEGDLTRLIQYLLGKPHGYLQYGVAQVGRAVELFLEEHTPGAGLKQEVARFAEKLEKSSKTDYSKLGLRLRDLLGQAFRLPLESGEPWMDAALADLRNMPAEQSAAWKALFRTFTYASGSAPTEKWLKLARAPLQTIGAGGYKQAVLAWFPLVDKRRDHASPGWPNWRPDPAYDLVIDQKSADLLRCLAWLCAEYEDADLARALANLAISTYRKLPELGTRSATVGNACIWALSAMPGSHAAGHLAVLKARLKTPMAKKALERAIRQTASRANLSPQDLEELAVPAYGMQESGLRRESLGEFTAELRVSGPDVELRWIRADGKVQASVPKAVKEGFPKELKELQWAAKDMQKMLAAQRERLDNLFLEQKKWDYAAWRERYIDHPLVGCLARRLIWKFTQGDQAASGIWQADGICGRDGAALAWLTEQTQVELWHPIQASAETVLEWRNWLREHQVQQPFKQAHREIYVVTDAERATGSYSNRFAAHIIRQHQFNALCGVRNWKNRLRLMVDDTCPPPSRSLPSWGLRAEFWVEPAGSQFGVDTNDTGTFYYLSTDQVRFYTLGAPQNYAYTLGGAYYTAASQEQGANPLALETIPPLVFSEIMRDVDLFVGVTSIGNDPNWMDGGPETRYAAYWQSFSFGDLTETAKVRRGVLENVLPYLKIADRCELQERYLLVKGKLHTYKIHLGSGNILMSPNDQYLCIVPAQNKNPAGEENRMFLPFEGDQTLAVILSKAFLLAEDEKIKDRSILSQIRRSA